jgi:hypothetical protein
MTKDSTLLISTLHKSAMKTPRKATLDFIRQFASAYAVLPEMGHTAMIIN